MRNVTGIVSVDTEGWMTLSCSVGIYQNRHDESMANMADRSRHQQCTVPVFYITINDKIIRCGAYPHSLATDTWIYICTCECDLTRL